MMTQSRWKLRAFEDRLVPSIDLDIEQLRKLRAGKSLDQFGVDLAIQCARAEALTLSDIAAGTALTRWINGRSELALRRVTRVAFIKNPPHSFKSSLVQPSGYPAPLRNTVLESPHRCFMLPAATTLARPEVLLLFWQTPQQVDGRLCNEFVFLCMVPWFVFSTRACEADSSCVLFSPDTPMPPVDELLRRIELPRRLFAMTPGNTSLYQRAPKRQSASWRWRLRLFSFAIRWHVKRQTHGRKRFFRQVVAEAPSDQRQGEDELYMHLIRPTFRMFRDTTAIDVIFNNSEALAAMCQMLREADLSAQHRAWFAAQIVDAMRVVVEREFVALGENAQWIFVESFLLPLLRGECGDDADVAWLDSADAGQPLHIDYALLKRHKIPLRFDELMLAPQGVLMWAGKLCLSLRHACQLAVALVESLLTLAADDSSTEREPRDAYRKLELELPINSRLYAVNRKGGYDDVLFHSPEHRALRPNSYPDVPYLTGKIKDSPPEILGFNLPAYYNMCREPESLVAHRFALPSQFSSSVTSSDGALVVSAEALALVGKKWRHSGSAAASATTTSCSSAPMDIEDLGTVPRNLHRNMALPMCARVWSHKLIDKRQHLKHAERGFYYRMMRSFELDRMDTGELKRHMLSASEPALLKKHEREIGYMEKFVAQVRKRSSEGLRVSHGLSQDDADKLASCIGNCRTLSQHSDAFSCPFARLQAQQLESALCAVNPLLAADKEALQRVMAATKEQGFVGGCMAEFRETRRALAPSIDPTFGAQLTMHRPKNYVHAAAHHELLMYKSAEQK